MSSVNKKRIVVGLSGGVDSSVTAALLLQQGHEVIAVYMRNWHDSEVVINNECPWIDDANDALLVAQHLGIPFQVLDLSEEYKSRIVDYMFSEYQQGRTPNPDVLCNREIKFDVFLKHALTLGADYVATGHYCRKEEKIIDGKIAYTLLAGKDPNKDQSYFLCQVNQEQLSKALFPIGGLEKSEVRKLAESFQLPNAKKKDSQGLCFVGKIKLPDFLQAQLKAKKGKVILLPEIIKDYKNQRDASIAERWKAKEQSTELSEICSDYFIQPQDGVEVGEHQGAHYFTIGQRKGLGIGGQEEPIFVVKTDTLQNIVYTVKGENHPLLFRRGLVIQEQDIHWINPTMAMQEGEIRKYKVRIRYRQSLIDATLTRKENRLYIVFNTPVKGVSPGQFAVWYEKEALIGSGVISF